MGHGPGPGRAIVRASFSGENFRPEVIAAWLKFLHAWRSSNAE